MTGSPARPGDQVLRDEYATGPWSTSADGRWATVAADGGIDVWEVHASPPRLRWHVARDPDDATLASHARLVIEHAETSTLQVLRLDAPSDEPAAAIVDDVKLWAIGGGRLVVADDDIVTAYGWPSLQQRSAIHLDRYIDVGVGATHHRTMARGDRVLIGDALVDLAKQTIVHQGNLPALSPDARSLALCAGKELQVVDSTTLAVLQKLDVSGTEICRTSWPSFSPDGSILLGVSETGARSVLVGVHTRTGAIYSQVVDTGGAERGDDITLDFGAGDPAPICIDHGNPSWSPECPVALDSTGKIVPLPPRTSVPPPVEGATRVLAGKLGMTNSAVVDLTTSQPVSLQPERFLP